MYQQRPTGVTIIAVLFFIAGALAILSGVYTLATPLPAGIPILTQLATYYVVVGIVAILVGALDVAVGWGLWTLQNWARILAIIRLALGVIGNLFSGVGLLVGVNVAGYMLSMPGPGIVSLLMAGIGAWLVWYLLKPDVAAAFGGLAPVVAPYVASTIPATPPPMPPSYVPTAAPPPSVAAPPSVRPVRQPTVPVGVQPAPEGWLVLRSGPRTGQQFGLKRGRNNVGRDPSRADIVLDEETVSGEHARIQFEQGQFYIYDLASTNGTFVNNRQIQKQLLMDGDVVRFGNAQVVFKRV